MAPQLSAEPKHLHRIYCIQATMPFLKILIHRDNLKIWQRRPRE